MLGISRMRCGRCIICGVLFSSRCITAGERAAMKVGEMATDIMATSTTKLTHSIYFAPSSLCAGLRMINMILSFESNRVEFFDHHKINVTQFKIEDQSAATIRRCWNSHKSRGAVFSLILQTRAKNAEIARLLMEKVSERGGAAGGGG